MGEPNSPSLKPEWYDREDQVMVCYEECSAPTDRERNLVKPVDRVSEPSADGLRVLAVLVAEDGFEVVLLRLGEPVEIPRQHGERQ